MFSQAVHRSCNLTLELFSQGPVWPFCIYAGDSLLPVGTLDLRGFVMEGGFSIPTPPCLRHQPSCF